MTKQAQTEPAWDLATKKGYMQFHADMCKRMQDITARKNADYTGDSPDPFSNFASVDMLGICSVEQGFLVRMNDKFKRIISLAAQQREAQVKDEAVEDTLLDLANYSILLAGYLRSKRTGQTRPVDNLLDHVR